MDLFRRGKKVQAEGVSLVTIPNVPIISTGIEYPLSTGPATFTEDDLRDAVRAAEEDVNVQHPRLKLAYGGPHDGFVTEPAFGKVVNLRLGDNDQTIYGDFSGVPEWLAEVLPVAYPSRSIEGNFNCETVGGKKYRLVISNVALLGVHLPGVTSLPDLAGLYGSEMPEGVVIDSAIQASVNAEDVRRNYYDSLKPEQMWWWIRAMELEATGGFLVVDDDEGQLYRVPFSIDGEEVQFGESSEVKIKYEDVPKDKMAASVVAGLADIRAGRMTVYATRAESRPTTATKEGGVDLDSKILAKRLGLPEDATEEQIMAKMDVLAEESEGQPTGGGASGEDPPQEPDDTPAVPDPEPGTPGGPGGPLVEGDEEDEEANAQYVKLDKKTYETLAANSAAAAKLVADNARSHREHIVLDAIKAGKILPARRDHFLKAMEVDPEGIEKLLTASIEDGGLAAGIVPVEQIGNGGNGDDPSAAEGLPEEWFGTQIAAAKQRAESGSRVTMAREA